MYILFDIGGTKMRIALSRDEKSFNDPVIVDTPQKFEDGISLFRETVSALVGGERILAMAGGIAGVFDKKKGMLSNSPNLPDWIGKPLREELEKACDTKVFIENDSALVGLGEALVGSGGGFNVVAYITVSTGVGGARIIEGKIDEAVIGFEPGHQIIDPDNTLCPECEGNDLESYVSGVAVGKRYGMKPYEIKEETLWEETLPKFLAYGLNNTVVHWSPDVVVLGGSMIVGDPAISVEATERYLKEIMHIFPNIPVIKKATLGAEGGLHGALAYLKQNSV
ncbi:MAG: ROK family protein [Patescibacteria group bacterium]|nr:ROK family protein [Patescibacteria group bacterium]